MLAWKEGGEQGSLTFADNRREMKEILVVRCKTSKYLITFTAIYVNIYLKNLEPNWVTLKSSSPHFQRRSPSFILSMPKKEQTLQGFLDNGALLIQARPTTVLPVTFVSNIDPANIEIQAPQTN